MADEIIYTVSEITNEIKECLEGNFPYLTVMGELSNFKAHVSGHWYFTLKDSGAALSGTMWRSYNSTVNFRPQDGMKVIVKGKITVYPPRGNYQMNVVSMQKAGEGELQAEFEKLKRKLHAEGLFDEAYKKSIPELPKKIGIVTAIDGAAFQDMINTAKRRYPLVELVIYPARVQGDGAAESIAEGINKLNEHTDVDTIIIGRGGGSLEDLWAFNEEIVARAIFNSKIPIISGVGHEVDFTISDFVADLRAATPTAAMELATPNITEIEFMITDFIENSHQKVIDIIEQKRENVDNILNSYGFRTPEDLVMNKSQFLDNLWFRIEKNIDSWLLREKSRLDVIFEKLEANNSDNILKKGYTLIKQNDKIIPRKSDLKDERITIKFFDGEIEVNNE